MKSLSYQIVQAVKASRWLAQPTLTSPSQPIYRMRGTETAFSRDFGRNSSLVTIISVQAENKHLSVVSNDLRNNHTEEGQKDMPGYSGKFSPSPTVSS